MGSASLISKIAAGGLSAGIFLIWWPGHVDGEGLGQLVVRGLLWTLAFELLLLAFAPLERLVAHGVKARIAGRRDRIRERLDQTPRPARTGGAVALASIGLLVPLLMLADPGRPKDAPAPKREVIKQVVVKRPVIKREVIVRPEVVSAEAPAPKTIVKRVVVEREKVVEKRIGAEPEKPAPTTPRTETATTPAPAPAAAPETPATTTEQPQP